MKSPLNWVGNKYKYMPIINKLVSGKVYNKVIDCFMGTGNILLNINCRANAFIGNDKNKLTPKLYKAIKQYNYNYVVDDFNGICLKFNNFSHKDDYYNFRDYWNSKYLNDIFDVDFIYETVMLLKMCSNSMVRFNSKKGYFNQGFRGLLKGQREFFNDIKKQNIIKDINELNQALQSKEYVFYNENFINLNEIYDDNNLLILDPPYSLVSGMYDLNYTYEHDEFLYELMSKTNNKFIFFNYLERDNEVNENLEQFINSNELQVIDINNQTLSGQKRTNTKNVREVIVHNIN